MVYHFCIPLKKLHKLLLIPILLIGSYILAPFYAVAKKTEPRSQPKNTEFIIVEDQEMCAALQMPVDGATNVPVDTAISWDQEMGFGYTINIGTSSGDSDILVTGAAFGSELIVPPLGLPENTDIFVNIIVRVDESDPTANIDCGDQQFRTRFITQLPDCTTINPFPDPQNVVLNPTFSWDYAPRATSYRLLVTRDTDNVVVFDQNVGNVLNFTLAGANQLDQVTTYRAVVIPIVNAQMINGEAIGCEEIIFTTTDIDTTPPECTALTSPGNDDTNVAFSPILIWDAVDDASGYFVTIVADDGELVLDMARFNGQSNTSTPVIDFEEGTGYCVTVQPFRTINAFDPPIDTTALGCDEICFSTALGCGPFEDSDTGEIIDLNPTFEELETIYNFCENDEPLLIEFTGNGTDFRWLRILENSTPPISNSRIVSIDEPGQYRLEVLDEIEVIGGTIICEASFEFEVTSSEAATILSITVLNQSQNSQITVNVEGSGDYEFSITSEEGPYQDSNVFNNVGLSNATVYVRDRNGCGVVSRSFGQQLGFPKFFTPNGDNFNDFWQVRGIVVDGQTITRIQIYDRFGKQITEFDPFVRGWDGILNGQILPGGGYWYRALTESEIIFTGFFVLKR